MSFIDHAHGNYPFEPVIWEAGYSMLFLRSADEAPVAGKKDRTRQALNKLRPSEFAELMPARFRQQYAEELATISASKEGKLTIKEMRRAMRKLYAET